MKKTSIAALVILAAIGGVGGGLLEIALAAGGRPIVDPPLTLGIALLVIGVLIVLLALPIRRLTRGRSSRPIDPFYATRVLVLSKASALSGALITGFGFGVAIYLLTRTIVSGGAVAQAVVTLVGAACLLAGGLVGENMCSIPPDDDDDDDHRPGKQPIRVRS